MYSGADTLTGGFPHSEIRGSTIARISPQLIAACHVLHRLLAPRHPPNALIALNNTTNARTQDQTPRYVHQLTKLTCSASLIHSCSRHHHATQSSRPAQHSQSRDQPIRFTCQTTRHPDQIPQDPQPGDKPVVQQHVTQPGTSLRTLNPSGQSFGDGRYRTDGPLLAKQVLYH